uniref:uncharacterized protein LOC120807665 n=1 Tax=Gasterosteus aculeatus aculeatus TaxID=481459 RepID=UPI001A993489|nr:uncharacterized protein LOC120807665 [Gasterosteus aculeatus aculeatus]
MLAWLDEAFDIQPYPRKQRGHGSELKETIKNRKLAVQKPEETATTNLRRKVRCLSTLPENALRSGESERLNLKPKTKYIGDMEQEEIGPENYYTRPLEESDIESDEVADSKNYSNQDHLQKPKRCSLRTDVCRESKASCLDVHEPSLTTTTNNSLSQTVANAKSLMCQPDERGLGGGGEQTHIPTSAPAKCDMKKEGMGTEINMWKMRANRVKQILSAEEFGPFNKSKSFGLEFNVGYGPKKNFSVDLVRDSFLVELAKFALAMNSSQQDFIMEILENNFDLNLKSEFQRNFFTYEMMKRVRHLKECEDSVKFSKEVFKLHGPLPPIRTASQSVNSVNAELSSISKMEESEVACGFPLHSQAEEHISVNSMDLYPFCKKIGLKLHVDITQPKKKQDINRLTYGAMTEVTNFAESLCGTFEQICVDILKHNLDLDLQCGGFYYVKSMVARIPAVLEKKNVIKVLSIRGHKTKGLTNVKLESLNLSNSDPANASSCQASVKNQEGSLFDTKHQPKLNLKLWQLRENQIQRILSRPHVEHCPLYSYSRCKKLGIDFNVGSGVQQNIDAKLLTNGIMVELSTFATEMVSAQKYFITEILEHNFHLDFNNELNRCAFAKEIQIKVRSPNPQNFKKEFELPDTNGTPEPGSEKDLYCPKCYQVRNQKHHQDESLSGPIHHPRPHSTTDANGAATNASSTSWEIAEEMMDSYPLCMEIDLNLFVNKDQPKNKLETHVLTHCTFREVASFAERLSGTKSGIINDVLRHNFIIGMPEREIDIDTVFYKEILEHDDFLSWLNEVFVIQHPSVISKRKRTRDAHGSEMMQSIKKRKLSLLTKAKQDAVNVPAKKMNKVRSVRQVRYFSDVYNLHLVGRDKVNEKLLSPNEDTQFPTNPGTVVQTDEKLLDTRCDSPLWVKLEIKEEEYDPRYGSTTPEPDPERQRCPLLDVKSEN